jgi:cation transport ATPase
MGLACGLATRYLAQAPEVARLILLLTLLAGGLPLVVGTVRGLLRGDFAADIVASLAIIGALVTDEYLAGCVIVLMETGGEALEVHATHRASSTLETLLARPTYRPSSPWRRRGRRSRRERGRGRRAAGATGRAHPDRRHDSSWCRGGGCVCPHR